VVIATERLDLHPFTVELASAIVAGDAAGRHWIEGFPREDDQDAAGMFLKLPGDTYCSYTIVDRGSGQTVGTIGFFGPKLPPMLPTFRHACRCQPEVLPLLFRELRQREFSVADELFTSSYDLYNGDLIEGGRGEILMRAV